MAILCEKRDDGTYHIGEVVLAPGRIERILAWLYYQFESQRLLPWIFHQLEEPPSLLLFLQMFTELKRSTLLCYREDPAGEFPVGDLRYTTIGMVWINESWEVLGGKFHKAEVGMAFVRVTNLEETLAAGSMAIEWAFDNLCLDVLVGCTPAPNRAAVLYGQKLGFVQAGPLPAYTSFNGKLAAAVVQSMTAERWRKMHLAEDSVAA